MNATEFYREAQALEKQCIEDRRYLHAHAETGFALTKTCAYVRRRLKEIGLAPQDCGRSGIICTLGKRGKTFLLRADMDALPIREESDLTFSCSNGNMHACGHDMHTAMLIAAAQLLKAHEDALIGRVKLMFQPAEEIFEGAADMLKAGVLENPHVDAALMFHVMTNQAIPTGTVIVSSAGVSAPAAGTFSIRIQGKGSHGAMPHMGVDPVNAAAHIVIALQEINARELAPSDSAALTIGCLRAGDAPNVIPDAALLRGNYRAFDEHSFNLIRRRIAEISEGIARIFRAEAQVEFHASCPTLINDAALAAFSEEQLGVLLGKAQVFNAARLAQSSASRSSGSEDFAAISHCVPSLMLALAAGHPADGYTHPLHHPSAIFDEHALTVGAAAYAWLAMKWLETNA